MHSPLLGLSVPASPARRSPRPMKFLSALIASALCGSLSALVRAEATSAGGARPGSRRIDFKSSNEQRDSSDTLLVGEVTAVGKAGLYVPLTKRPRSDGAVYGVDVGEGGISRRRLEGTGVGIEEGGEGIITTVVVGLTHPLFASTIFCTSTHLYQVSAGHRSIIRSSVAVVCPQQQYVVRKPGTSLCYLYQGGRVQQ